MKRNLMAAPLAVAVALCGSAVLSAQATKVDAGIPGYSKTSGVSGNLTSVGSDTLNNLMTLWAEGYKREYPNIRIQIEGKGSSTAPPALIQGTSQLGPMSRTMKAEEIDAFEKKYGYKPTAFRVAVDGIGVFVNKDNPVKCLTMQQIDGIFSKGHACGGKSINAWGEAGVTDGGWGNQPISLYGRNSASGTYGLLQGARALQGRLPRHRQGAAGLGLGGPGRDRGQVRRRLQRHRLQDLGRAHRPGGRQGGPVHRRQPGERDLGQVPAVALPLRLRQQGAQQAARSAGPRVSEVRAVAAGADDVVKDGFIPLPGKIVDEELAKLR